jgi:hypothetical protein
MTLVRDHAGTPIVDSSSAAAVALATSDSDRVSVQTDKSDTAFATLLTASIVLTATGRISADFAASFVETTSLTGARGEFQLLIDGSPVEAAAEALDALNEPGGVAITHRSGVLGAGPHTVTVQWRRATNDGSLRIAPIDIAGITGAQLVIEEVG